MHDKPKGKIPLKVLSLTAMLKSVSGAANFLFHVGALDHESTAILCDLWRSLEATAAEERREHGWSLMRSVVEQLVPLSNRVSKELHSIKDNPVAAYHLRHIHEAAKLLEGEKMVKRKREEDF